MREIANSYVRCAIFLLKLRTCPDGNIVRTVGVGTVVLCDVRLPSSDKGYCSLFAYVEIMIVVRPWRGRTDAIFIKVMDLQHCNAQICLETITLIERFSWENLTHKLG